VNKLSAIHTIWTNPYIIKNQYLKFTRAEMLTLVISALLWRKYNGAIKLYTDSTGLNYIHTNNLEWLYDEGIDIDTLTYYKNNINPEIFWAAGKILALHAHKSPCVMLDYDLIVVKSIHEIIEDFDVVALHPEELHSEFYLKPELLKLPDGYEFPEQFDWDIKPLNTAFLYLRDPDFKHNYAQHALDFMNNNGEYPKEFISQMVFAEQRMLAMTAAMYKQKIGWLLNDPFELSNRHIIHLWGFKQELRNDLEKEEVFISRLLRTFRSELRTCIEFENFLRDNCYYDYAL